MEHPWSDYLPSVFAFAFTLSSILTATRDSSKRGPRSITRIGVLLLCLSAVSLAYGIHSVRATHRVQDKRAVIAQIARHQIVDGISLLVKPLCGDRSPTTDTRELFALLRSDDNLVEVGKERAVRRRSTLFPPDGRLVGGATSLPYQEFDELYQLYDHYVSGGQDLITQTLGVFGTYLSEDELIAASRLISDAFLNEDYKLSGKTTYFELGRIAEGDNFETSPWNTVGLHYFDAVYDGPSERAGNHGPVSEFLTKAETAVLLTLQGDGEEKTFVPCGLPIDVS